MDIASWSPRILSVLRMMTGLLVLKHGTQKLLGFPPPANAGPALFSLLGLARDHRGTSPNATMLSGARGFMRHGRSDRAARSASPTRSALLMNSRSANPIWRGASPRVSRWPIACFVSTRLRTASGGRRRHFAQMINQITNR
jgi:hypothetical protein